MHVVERPARIDAGHEKTEGRDCVDALEGDDESRSHRLGIRPRHERSEAGLDIGHDEWPGSWPAGERPPAAGSGRREGDRRRKDGLIVQPGAAHEVCVCAAWTGEIKRAERHVRRVSRECVCGERARTLGGCDGGRLRSQFAERGEAAGGDDVIGRLVDDAENSGDRARVVQEGAIGQREEAFLEIAAPVDGKECVLEGDGLSGVDAAKQRLDDAP